MTQFKAQNDGDLTLCAIVFAFLETTLCAFLAVMLKLPLVMYCNIKYAVISTYLILLKKNRKLLNCCKCDPCSLCAAAICWASQVLSMKGHDRKDVDVLQMLT